MPSWFANARTQASRLWKLVVRVVKAFLDNQGLLLAGGLAYNSLLSAIPLVAVVVMALSYFLDQQLLFATITKELTLLIPSHATTLTDTVRTLLDNRSVIGGVGIVVLLFFSSIAFRMLEEAIATIFHVPDHVEGRSFWMSALIPYLYMGTIGLGIVALTSISAVVQALSEVSYVVLGWEVFFDGLPGVVLDVCGFLGMAALFTSIYKVLPVVDIQLKRAIIGGFIAAILWEIIRRITIWYFASVSLVNVIYGSLGTVIVVLLGLEIGAIIVLLGAQVIAELEHNAELGIDWYEDPSATGDPPPTEP